MYVKLYSKILDSSIASNRNLRHFFIDLLLLADPDGFVILTKEAIARRAAWDLSEVEWGLAELMKPEPGETGDLESEGRRIEPLPGHGYGWRILNYAKYRDFKSAHELRKETAERVKRCRERKKLEAEMKRRKKKALPQPGEGFLNGEDVDTGAVADRVNREMAENRAEREAESKVEGGGPG